MKYSKYLLVVFLAFSLTSCALLKSKKGKTDAVKAGADKAVIQDSLSFIPAVKIDEKTGKVMPYNARPNPYLQIKKQLPAAAVGQFIAAKRDIELKRFPSAESILERLTKEFKQLSGPWYLLGEISLEKKEFEAAEKHFKQAISVNSRNVNAHLRLALSLRQQGKYIEAQNEYVRLLRVWRDFPEAHLNLGILYDIYLNQALEGQRHYEAYDFLTQGRNQTVASWLEEIRGRTGKDFVLQGRKKKAVSEDSNPGASE